MAAPKGHKRYGGRTKGTPNKTTVIAIEAIEMAFHGIGGPQAFTAWANENQGDFYRMIFPKLLPVQLNHADAEGDKLEGFRVILVGNVGKPS